MELSIKNKRSIFRRIYDKAMPDECRNAVHNAVRENKNICDTMVCVIRQHSDSPEEVLKKVAGRK